MPEEVKEIEVAVPEVQKGTVSFMTKEAFRNPAPEKLKRVLKALNYFAVSMITMVSATDLFSGYQSKVICFILGIFILLLGAIGLATGVKTEEDSSKSK